MDINGFRGLKASLKNARIASVGSGVRIRKGTKGKGFLITLLCIYFDLIFVLAIIVIMDIKERVKEAKRKNNLRLKANYNFAREIGFSSQEAILLRQSSIKNITKVAEEKGMTKKDNI